MFTVLPQQRLLLELLCMSGNIAVPDKDNGTLLYMTLQECRTKNWIKLTPFGAGFDKAEITDSGRQMVKNRRVDQDENSGPEKRRGTF